MTKTLAITFVRNPELGKVKTRLAKTIGKHRALEVYITLLEHTKTIMSTSNFKNAVFYSEHIPDTDLWADGQFLRFQQKGNHLGARMLHAFETGFNGGYNRIILIGSDLPNLSVKHLNQAYNALANHEVVIGPANDGGYYLIGMNKIHAQLFKRKNWGTSSVLKETLCDSKGLDIAFLEPLNDIDTFEDLEATTQFIFISDEYTKTY